jgi:ATP-dependent protease HslVU (ClpYQ) ATPase subunit
VPVNATLEVLTRILQSTKGSLIRQDRKLVRFHGADSMFTDAAIREIAKIALDVSHGSQWASIGR